jgi:DNA-binding beta-propeller fold protein YncE
VAIDPAGRFAYVTNSGDNDVFAYRINAGSGALTGTALTMLAPARYGTVVEKNLQWPWGEIVPFTI